MRGFYVGFPAAWQGVGSCVCSVSLTSAFVEWGVVDVGLDLMVPCPSLETVMCHCMWDGRIIDEW